MSNEMRRFSQVLGVVQDAMMRHWKLPESVAAEVGFHMADWVDSLDDLSELMKKDSWSEDDFDRFYAALIDGPEHFAAAAKIVRGHPVEDVFGLGATLGDGVEREPPGLWKEGS